MSAVPPWAHPLWWGWQLRTPRLAACWGWRPRAHPPRAPPGLMVLLKRQAGLGPDPLQVKIYGGIWESASVKVLSQLLNSREGAGGQQHHGTAMRGGLLSQPQLMMGITPGDPLVRGAVPGPP